MSNLSLHLSLWAKPPSLGTWRTLTLSFLTGLLVSACGGGTSTSTTADPTSNESNSITSPFVNPSTNSTVTLGVYTAPIPSTPEYEKEIITIVMRTATLTNDTAQLYALRFNSPDPDIYAGSVKGIGNNTASIDNLTYFKYLSGTLRTGTAALSVPVTGYLKVVTSLGSPTLGALDETWVSKPNNSLKLDTAATTSQLAGVWTGRFTYPFGVAEKFSITFTTDPTSSEPNRLTTTSSTFFQQDCQMTLGEAKPALGGVNLFTVSFKVPSATQCFLKNQTLTGVAYVTSSPVAGKTQRLQWIAVAPDGRGVSFRADR